MLAATSRFSGCIWQGQKKNKQECLIFTVVPSRKKRKGDKKKRKVTGQQKIHEIYSEESVSKKKSET